MEIPKSFSVNKSLAVAAILILLGVTLRLLPHVPNFAPIGAIALFGGAILGWRMALWLPLSAMVLSDLVIGFYPGIGWTWGAFVLIALFGMLLKKSQILTKAVFGGFASATIFFIVSNLGVWASSGMYRHTFDGLVQCYTMALPFFRMTFVSDMFYSSVLFGSYALAIYMLKRHSGANNQVHEAR